MSEEQTKEQSAPEIAMSKAEFTDFVSKKVNEALAPKLRKIEEMQSQIEELGSYREKAQELEQQIAGKQQSASQKWEAERSQLEQRQKALQAEIEKHQQETQATKQRWYDTHRREYITALALEAGASPTAAADVAALFPGSRINITEGDSGLSAEIIDTETGLKQDPSTAMRDWLTSKPHLMAAPPRGSGSGGATPPKQTGPKDPLEGKYGTELFKAAFYGK